MGAHRVVRRPASLPGLQQRAWNAMRIVAPGWTIADLDLLAGNGSESARADLRRYVGALVGAGLVTVTAARGQNGQKYYRLRKDTGPIAPSHRREAGQLHDHNTGKTHETGKIGGAPCRPASP